MKPTEQPIGAQIAIKLAGSFMARGGLFLAVLFLSRYASQSEIGQIFVLLSVVQIAAVVFQFGLPKAIIPFVVQNRMTPRQICTAGAVGLTAFLVVYGVFLAAGPWGENIVAAFLPVDIAYVKREIWAVPGLMVIGFVIHLLQARHQTLLRTIFEDILQPLALMVALVVSVWGGQHLLRVFSASHPVALAVLTILAVYAGCMHYRAGKVHGGFSWPELMRNSWPVYLTALLGVVYSNSDVLLVAALTESHQVGIYAMAGKIAVLVSFPLAAAQGIILPHAVKAIESRAGRLRFTQRFDVVIAQIGCLSSVVVVVLLAGLANIEFVLAPGYQDVVLPAVVLIGGWMFTAVLGPIGIAMTMIGRQKIVLFGSAGAIAINCGLMFVLVPMAGALGAAIATTVSLFCLRIILFVVGARHLFYWRRLRAVGTVLMACAVQICALALFACGGGYETVALLASTLVSAGLWWAMVRRFGWVSLGVWPEKSGYAI